MLVNTVKFGLFSWAPGIDPREDRKLKEGSKALIRLYKTLPDDVEALRAVARETFSSRDSESDLAPHEVEKSSMAEQPKSLAIAG